MATTLVESPLFPHRVPRNVQQPPHPAISFSVAPSPLELSAAQLAPLASQHHTSEYNQHKFGIQGCPVPYLPLSVQLPDYFDELQRRQVRCSQDKSWWPCHKADVPPTVVLSSAGAQTQETLHLQEEIQAAMAEPLNNIPQGPHNSMPNAKRLLHPSIKTSSTHPINISSIVPPELLPIISSNLCVASSLTPCPPPVVFEVPKLFALDRLTLASTRHVDPRGYRAPDPYPTNSLVVGHLRTRSNIRDALRAAMNGGLSGIDANLERGKIKRDALSRIPSPTPLQRSASTGVPHSKANLSTVHSNTSSISLSLSLTIAETPSASSPNILSNGPGTPKRLTCSLLTSDSRSDAGSSESLPAIKGMGVRSSNPLPSIPLHVASPKSPPQTQTSSAIGNLYLSSCPGKKGTAPFLKFIIVAFGSTSQVRLQGPVKGRSGVCRDLDTDLKRMKELGVGCIICCLDDQELEFLGAPWPEYEECARINGIDVLRIPIPEGLAPLTPASLNTHLTYLIDTYTSRGIPLLVHCRGGVGRAGVVACCWIIKLGLCGWIETDAELSTTSSLLSSSISAPKRFGGPGSPPIGETHGNTKYNTVHFVERVIAVVRRRRSIKAVETYEQVKFLVDFVEYLKDGVMA